VVSRRSKRFQKPSVASINNKPNINAAGTTFNDRQIQAHAMEFYKPNETIGDGLSKAVLVGQACEYGFFRNAGAKSQNAGGDVTSTGFSDSRNFCHLMPGEGASRGADWAAASGRHAREENECKGD
jgi:hypothetical protein